MASMTVDRVQVLKDYGQSLRQIHFLPVASFGHMWMKLSAVQIPDKWTLTVLMLPMVLWGQIVKKKAAFILFGRYGHPFKYIH